MKRSSFIKNIFAFPIVASSMLIETKQELYNGTDVNEINKAIETLADTYPNLHYYSEVDEYGCSSNIKHVFKKWNKGIEVVIGYADDGGILWVEIWNIENKSLSRIKDRILENVQRRIAYL